jgi:hypothetical protein
MRNYKSHYSWLYDEEIKSYFFMHAIFHFLPFVILMMMMMMMVLKHYGIRWISYPSLIPYTLGVFLMAILAFLAQRRRVVLSIIWMTQRGRPIFLFGGMLSNP